MWSLPTCAVNLPHITPTCLPEILDFQPNSVPEELVEGGSCEKKKLIYVPHWVSTQSIEHILKCIIPKMLSIIYMCSIIPCLTLNSSTFIC